MEQSGDETEVDLKEVYLILRQNILLIVFVASFTGMLTGLVCRYLVPKQYESTSKLYILPKTNVSGVSISGLLSGSSSAGYEEFVSIRPVIEEVIDSQGLDETYESMKEKISVEMPSSYILKITVSYDNPVTAMFAVNDLAEVTRQSISRVMSIDEPQILETGIIPDEPVSPMVLKNMLVAVVLGGLGAAAVLVAWYLFTDTGVAVENRENQDS